MSNPADPFPFVLDHVAIGVASVAEVSPYLSGELAGREFASGPGVGFLWWQWQFANGSVIEVIEPHGAPGGFVHRFLAARGPGVHHVTFKVPDLAAAAASVRSHGLDVVGYDDSFPGWKECFIHPKQAQGIVVQLAEAHPELEPDGMAQGFPAGAPPATEPADVTAVRLTATSAARARKQWEALLGGRCEVAGDTLRFRWPASPLAIIVDVDASAPEGPTAIEVAGGPGDHAATAHPSLGVRFTTA